MGCCPVAVVIMHVYGLCGVLQENFISYYVTY